MEESTRYLPDRGPDRPTGSRASIPTRYDLLGEVGRGGMGVVYRARQQPLGREVAIKVLLAGASEERFLREGKLLAMVRSPHVVAVHDFEILPDGSPMLVMEWVEGEDLRRKLQRDGRLSESAGLIWMRQTAEGMRAAADQGIVHRDLKPANILVDTAGRARVADFGLARGPVDLSLTMSGQLAGTPLYMAPEQWESPRSVDTRADIYSFGATFYHLLTGKPPFDGDSFIAVLFKHKTEPLISPKARVTDLSARTTELLERCLAKAPKDRFQSFTDVANYLGPEAGAASAWEFADDPDMAKYVARYESRRPAYGVRPLAEDIADCYEFSGGRSLHIVRGNILDQQVDAVVSSDDVNLTMSGGVSAAIRARAGLRVVEEVRRYGAVRPGRAVVTSGGDLKARYVFHGVTLAITYGAGGGAVTHAPSRDVIAEIMASCFYHADSLNVQTIAFPLLGTGTGGFPADVCLDTMFRYLVRTLLRGLTSVREARIVLYA